MYHKISHQELVQLIMRDCSYSRGVAETIAIVLGEHEDTYGESLEYDPAKIKSSYACYASVEEAYKYLIGTTEKTSDASEMKNALVDSGYIVYYPRFLNESGVIIEMRDYTFA